MSAPAPDTLIPATLYGGVLDGYRCHIQQKNNLWDTYLFEHRFEETLTRLAYRFAERSDRKGRWVLVFDCIVSRQKITA